MNEEELKEFAGYCIVFGLKYGMHGVSPESLINWYYKDKSTFVYKR